MENVMENIIEDLLELCGIDQKRSNKKYRMFFDETNNVRKFRLTDTGFNTDANLFFVLGGIVSDIEIPLKSINELWNSISESKSQDELKFKTIRKGAKTFPDLLNKPHFQRVINWILENNYWIHFFYMDNFYYSITDIVDSLPFASKVGSLHASRHYKTALYQAIKFNRNKCIQIFRENNYPDVKNSIAFLNSIEELIKDYIKSDEFEAYYHSKNDPTFSIILQGINKAKKEGLPFLTDNVSGELIKEYYLIYYQQIVLFENSYLTFDHEVDVEREIDKIALKNNNYQFVESSISKALERHEFIDEKTHKLVQLSDILVGAMGMFLTYINSDDTNFLINISEATNWNKKQLKTFNEWTLLLQNSLNENEFFKGGSADEFLELRYNYFTGERFHKIINE